MTVIETETVSDSRFNGREDDDNLTQCWYDREEVVAK